MMKILRMSDAPHKSSNGVEYSKDKQRKCKKDLILLGMTLSLGLFIGLIAGMVITTNLLKCGVAY
jgi:hypothetical protein